jgi:hypothetical protein
MESQPQAISSSEVVEVGVALSPGLAEAPPVCLVAASCGFAVAPRRTSSERVMLRRRCTGPPFLPSAVPSAFRHWLPPLALVLVVCVDAAALRNLAPRLGVPGLAHFEGLLSICSKSL